VGSREGPQEVSFMRSMLGAPLLALVSLLLPFATQAQTQADCTFNFFSLQTTLTLSDGTPVFMQPRGINDFGTIVGRTYPNGINDFGAIVADSSPHTGHRGLIRWANGGVTVVKGTKSLLARNDQGTSAGLEWTGEGVLVNGTTLTPIVLDLNNTTTVYSVNGINKWGTVVGSYVTPDRQGHAFKRWKNGTTHTLQFPGTLFPSNTRPAGINDVGTVVGTYFGNHGMSHGFIFHNGQWATLDYPHASGTALVGITNAGKILGIASFYPTSVFTQFLYENGAFKVISVPNSSGTPWLMSVSPKQGLILGIMEFFPTGKPAFIAQCQ
jgi:uncharacterized membrane protein